MVAGPAGDEEHETRGLRPDPVAKLVQVGALEVQHRLPALRLLRDLGPHPGARMRRRGTRRPGSAAGVVSSHRAEPDIGSWERNICFASADAPHRSSPRRAAPTTGGTSVTTLRAKGAQAASRSSIAPRRKGSREVRTPPPRT